MKTIYHHVKDPIKETVTELVTDTLPTETIKKGTEYFVKNMGKKKFKIQSNIYKPPEKGFSTYSMASPLETPIKTKPKNEYEYNYDYEPYETPYPNKEKKNQSYYDYAPKKTGKRNVGMSTFHQTAELHEVSKQLYPKEENTDTV